MFFSVSLPVCCNVILVKAVSAENVLFFLGEKGTCFVTCI